jgi:hypothetical protein
MNNNLGWKNALGIAFDIPPIGQRNLDSGNGPYTELANRFEVWLRDIKGITSYEQFDYETGINMRKEFFIINLKENPEWYSQRGIKQIEANSGEEDLVINGKQFKCKNCPVLIRPTTLITHKC